MTLPRHVLLNQPHMGHLLDLPGLKRISTPDLAILESFMRFCAEKALDDPRFEDIRAFADLRSLSPQDVLHLNAALAQLDAPDEILIATEKTMQVLHNRTLFKHVPSDLSLRVREVSVPSNELPDPWKRTLRRLVCDQVHPKDIMDRMERRLCMFVWSARQAGLPVDLGSLPSLQAFYCDIRARSAEKNEGEPRFSYLRSSFEELCRFAKAHGEPEATVQQLSATLRELQEIETRQTPMKFAKAAEIGGASPVLAKAMALLRDAETHPAPKSRHARRNAAAALALGVAVPARPSDIYRHHIFGHGIFYMPEKGTYRFTYIPQKTLDRISTPLDLHLTEDWNPFIEALILQDHDRKYLSDLRRHAIETKRPLYVNYDGSPCSPLWYSRIWAQHVGTGGHIARTLIYDEMGDSGEAGIQYGKLVNHHRSQKIPNMYRSVNSFRKSVKVGQAAMLASYNHAQDDISDLL